MVTGGFRVSVDDRRKVVKRKIRIGTIGNVEKLTKKRILGWLLLF